jgi:hypothetical protein
MKTFALIVLLLALGAARQPQKQQKIYIDGSSGFADQARETFRSDGRCYQITPSLKDADVIFHIEEHYSAAWAGSRKVEAALKTPSGETIWRDRITWRLGHLKAGKDLASRAIKQTCH